MVGARCISDLSIWSVPSLTTTIGVRTGPHVLTIVLEMTVLANGGGSLYIKFVHLVGALSDHYHRRPLQGRTF